MSAADFVIELFSKRLQIHIGSIHMFEKIAPWLIANISGRHGNGLDVLLVAGIGNIHCIFHKDYRIIVSISDATAAQFFRSFGNNPRWCMIGENIHFTGFGHVPILTKLASQVTARGAK